MKKTIVIVLIICLFACKNNANKTEALDFCMEQSENIIREQNNSLIKKFERLAVDDPSFSNSLEKFQFNKANKGFKLYTEFEKKISEMELKKKVSLPDLKKSFNQYLDTLFANTFSYDTIDYKIQLEKYRKMEINDTKTYSLTSAIILNEFLNQFFHGCYLDYYVDDSQIIIVPTKNNYKIGDHLQLFFSEVYRIKTPKWNFTQFTRNGTPLNIKDLNYDKYRRMIDFKIKEKGTYIIKGYEVISNQFDFKYFSDTIPFETEYVVK